MRVIALDAMGGDHGPQAVVAGAQRFVQQHAAFKVILVGDEKVLAPLLAVALHPQLSIAHAPAAVAATASLSWARRDDTSMAVALRLMADQKVGAVISAGNSAVYLTSAALQLPRLAGVRRAAFMTITPAIDPARSFLLLDVGANLEASPEMLVEWANLGVAFARAVLRRSTPTVGLINIGTEETKGLANVQAAHQLLKSAPLQYEGFVEPRDILKPVVDVAVIDGYGGNIVLKTVEGTAMSLMRIMKTNLTASLRGKLGGWLVRPTLSALRDRFDYRYNGAAWVVGFEGLVIKAHGASDEIAFESALGLAATAIDQEVVAALKTQLQLSARSESEA